MVEAKKYSPEDFEPVKIREEGSRLEVVTETSVTAGMIDQEADMQAASVLTELERQYRHQEPTLDANTKSLDDKARETGMLNPKIGEKSDKAVQAALSDVVNKRDHARLFAYAQGTEKIMLWGAERLGENYGEKVKERLAAKIAKQIPDRVIKKWEKTATSIDAKVDQFYDVKTRLKSERTQAYEALIVGRDCAVEKKEQASKLEGEVSKSKEDYSKAVNAGKPGTTERDRGMKCSRRIQKDIDSKVAQYETLQEEIIDLDMNCTLKLDEIRDKDSEIGVYSSAIGKLRSWQGFYRQQAHQARRYKNMESNLTPVIQILELTDKNARKVEQADMTYVTERLHSRAQGMIDSVSTVPDVNSSGKDYKLDTPSDREYRQQKYVQAVSNLERIDAQLRERNW